MALFILGLVILIVGGFFYGKFVEKIFGPDDRDTPAVRLADGVDYVEMSKGRNALIELLNIAGTGPILGPIQGILFGPIAFLTIPIGCVLAGAVHDYFVGMISMRNNGWQVPRLITKYMGSKANKIYIVIICILMLLTGVVFIYTPGDLIVNDLLGMDVNGTAIWIAYAGILLYYIVATLFPIDKIIGRIYPIFGAVLVLSAVFIFIGILLNGAPDMHNITEGALLSKHPTGQMFIPVFFITVACGIMSGFHGSQATLISRTVKSEHEGRGIFYNSMIIEGFIAMVWAAGAMNVFNRGAAIDTNATLMVGNISREFMGTVGGLFAIAGVIVLPITSGDTAFRSLRLMVAEQINMDQSTPKNRVLLYSRGADSVLCKIQRRRIPNPLEILRLYQPTGGRIRFGADLHLPEDAQQALLAHLDPRAVLRFRRRKLYRQCRYRPALADDRRLYHRRRRSCALLLHRQQNCRRSQRRSNETRTINAIQIEKSPYPQEGRRFFCVNFSHSTC